MGWLVYDWKRVLKRAWSIRLMGVAALLSAVEVAMPYFEFRMQPGAFAFLSAIATAAAFAMRLIAQSNMRGE